MTPLKTYNWTNPQEPNKIIKVDEEIWKWEAVYNNETTLHQFDDETGQFHRMWEIDKNNLLLIKMTSRIYPQVHRIFFPQTLPLNYDLIIRHERITKASKLKNGEKDTLFIVGYKSPEQSGFLCITPQNECIIIDDYAKIVIQ